MRDYRLVLLLKSELKKDQKEKLLVNLQKWIGEASFDKVTEMGEKKLSYPIKREKKADYVLLSFKANSVSPELDKRLVMQDDILRHLLIKD